MRSYTRIHEKFSCTVGVRGNKFWILRKGLKKICPASFRETCHWLKFPLNGLRAQSWVSPVVGLLPLAWTKHVNRIPRNRLPRVIKYCSPTGRRNHGRPLKRLLDTWDRNGSTSNPTPWQTYDDDDDDDNDDDCTCLEGKESVCKTSTFRIQIFVLSTKHV